MGFRIRDYIVAQAKFSFGQALSVPVGLACLYFFTSVLGIWYLYSSVLTLMVTTVMNLWVQVALKTVRLSSKPSNQ